MRDCTAFLPPTYKRTHIFRQCLTFWLVLQDSLAFTGCIWREDFFYYSQKKEKGQPVWCHTHQRKLPKKSQALHILLNMMEATRKKKKMQHILEKQRVLCGFLVCLFVCFVLVWLVLPPHSEKVLGLNPVWSLFEWPVRGDLSGYLSFHPQSKDMHGVRFTGNSNLPVGINAFLSLCAAHWQLRCTRCTLPLALWQMGKAPAPLRAEESMVWSDTVYVWPNYAHWNPKIFTR